MMKRILIGAACLAATAGAALAEPVAITNARVVTNAEAGVIDGGTVLIEDGVVTALGADIAVPDDAETLDAGGGWVTPGVFAPFTHLGLVEVSLTEGSNDISAEASPLQVAVDAVDSFNPRATPIPITRIEGVTHAAISPSTGATLFGGRGAVIDLSGDMTESVVKQPAFLYVRLGEAGSALAGGSRAAAWAYLRAALDEARRSQGLFARAPAEPLLKRADSEALAAALKGQIPLVVEAHRASDILKLIELRRDYRTLDVILLGGAEAWSVAEAVAEADLPVILDPMANLPESFEELGARIDAARLLHEAGVRFAFTTGAGNDDTHQVRLLLQQAGNAVAHGLPWDAAFEAITLRPAEFYGLDGRLGALATGRAANLLVWDGDPLEVTSAPNAVFIAGESIPMRSRQTELRDRYMTLDDSDAPFAYRR